MIKNKIVENILKQRSEIERNSDLNESLGEMLPYASETYFIIKKILGKKPEETDTTVEPVSQPEVLVNPKSLTQDAPSVRYLTTPGFQLSRASTIA